MYVAMIEVGKYSVQSSPVQSSPGVALMSTMHNEEIVAPNMFSMYIRELCSISYLPYWVCCFEILAKFGHKPQERRVIVFASKTDILS